VLPATFCLIAFVMAYRNQRDQRLAVCGTMAALACGALHAMIILILLRGL
jgi:lipopolysaccharide export LptBFGC system permease protein LptF